MPRLNPVAVETRRNGVSVRDKKFLKLYFGECDCNGVKAMLKADPSMTYSQASAESTRTLNRLGVQTVLRGALERRNASLGDALNVIAQAMNGAYRLTTLGEQFPDFRTRVEAAKIIVTLHGVGYGQNAQQTQTDDAALSWEQALAQDERGEAETQEAEIVSETESRE